MLLKSISLAPSEVTFIADNGIPPYNYRIDTVLINFSEYIVHRL